MDHHGPIIIVEDDSDDRYLLLDALKDIKVPNELIFFENGEKAYNFLETTAQQPFMILSDINMPGMTGIELRDKLHANLKLKLKTVPYLFYTTAGSKGLVDEVFMQSAQGYFVKPVSISEIHTTLRIIIAYWTRCSSPNSVNN